MPSRYNANCVLIWEFIGRLEVDPTSSSASMLSLSAAVKLLVFFLFILVATNMVDGEVTREVFLE